MGADAGTTPEGEPVSAEGKDLEAEDHLRALDVASRVLIDVRDELYGGDWADLEHDLRSRLAGKPYIFKLATKIEEDLARLERLRRYEAQKGVDLGEVKRRLEHAAARDAASKETGDGALGGAADKS